tara:strand:- start:754 stop:1089 length:336 start_codon:yes stop_codon:yes gene_type:complete
MISGENSIVTKVLENAVSSSILAGSLRVSEKNRAIAIDNELKLLKYHREAGHQTPFETERSLKTSNLLKREHRRWNLTPGFVSVAETARLAAEAVMVEAMATLKAKGRVAA